MFITLHNIIIIYIHYSYILIYMYYNYVVQSHKYDLVSIHSTSKGERGSFCDRSLPFTQTKVTESKIILFFLSFFYQLEPNYFTILQWFLLYIDMNQPWVYMYSPSRSPLLPPSPPNPSGSSQCTSPEHLSHASNLGW